MMAARGLAKLAEELGELGQVVGKKLAYYWTDTHPDGGPSLRQRLEDEIADVIAACLLVVFTFGLDRGRIIWRLQTKYTLFRQWDADVSNNALAIDANLVPLSRRARGHS